MCRKIRESRYLPYCVGSHLCSCLSSEIKKMFYSLAKHDDEDTMTCKTQVSSYNCTGPHISYEKLRNIDFSRKH